ncbi:uncharacterized protein FMAN_03343 [Fusarium mangiferae]|uniref:Uncharacterized protein n=1 Tax=Fusarium mangiferae TaxID=192010 RepID=A0A1L7TER7_FUSMA|nr:uncharacterized protein FMAN_03343 [Fusarium mangiferae]CVK94105.1 uncharacterized protein FMAN_03343 [Fusarium mangiferae]
MADDLLFSSKLDRILRLNHRLTMLINNLAQKTGDIDITQEVKNLLKQLYDSFSRLSDVLSRNLRCLAFLLPTYQALRQLPSCGEFVAARLLLFTGWTFTQAPGLKLKYKGEVVQETKPLHEFIADLDDALLEPLTKMWELSQSRERFDWIYTDFNITHYDEMSEALALSPQELKDLDGIRGPIPRWDCGEQDWDDFEWKEKGSDGPLNDLLEYNYRDDDAPDVNFANNFHIFRRSHQFCLDARQKSEAHIGRQQHQIFDDVARHLGLPPEMRNRILSYVEYRDPFPYLEKIDLAEAYVPFPKVGEHCTRCGAIEGESTAQRTCPQKAIHVWNLALRRFHTFHRNSCKQWSLCTQHDCTGHHDDEEDWEVAGEPEFTRYLESLAARGNDEFASLDQVGLGPMHPIRLEVEADTAREYALFGGNGIYGDSSDDARMIGGLGGLKDAMIHGRTLITAWEGYDDDSIFYVGAQAWEPSWQYGRNLYDEKVATVVIKRLHSEDECESCVEAEEQFDEFPLISV